MCILFLFCYMLFTVFFLLKKNFFCRLFGTEDVDLRVLAPIPKTPLKSQTSSSPPRSSGEKDTWAKVKKSEKFSDGSRSSSDSRSNRDQRSNRLKPYSRPNALENDSRDRRRSGPSGGRDNERDSDGNAEFIMRQAAEQLNQGTITKIEYNKIIQGVLHMSEDQKLKAAQRKERESKGNWDRSDKGIRSKDHSMHPRPPG